MSGLWELRPCMSSLCELHLCVCLCEVGEKLSKFGGCELDLLEFGV